MKYELLKFIDISGTAAFAVSGVFAAMQKKLDIFGILIIAFITSVGGGTLRDILVGDLPVSWMKNMNYFFVIIIATVTTIMFNSFIKNFQRTLLVFDSLGMGFFTILGLQKGILFGLSPAICIALGTVTACFGGVIRDISLNNIPVIFQKEMYATVCILGGAFYFLLMHIQAGREVAEMVSIAFVFIIRLLAVFYKWSLPSPYGRRNRDKIGK